MQNNYNADYNSFYTIKTSLEQSQKNWFQLTDKELLDLTDLSQGTNNFIGSKAEDI